MTELERRVSPDTDGDGIKDCDDPDDDNDGATDELEDHVFGREKAAHIQRDQDGDGIPDPEEFFPLLPSGKVAVSIQLLNYTHDGSGCDPYPWLIEERADPYFTTLLVEGLPGGAVDLTADTAVQNGWSKNNHVDNRASGPMGLSFPLVGLSPRINEWYVLDLPLFMIEAVLMDHDDGVFDDQMDLSHASDEKLGFSNHRLSYDLPQTKFMQGNASCEAKLNLKLSDNVPFKEVALATAWYHAKLQGRIATLTDYKAVSPGG